MALSVALSTSLPPGLQEATKKSTISWQHDLESLFHHTKDRFPDVVWELVGDDSDDVDGPRAPADEIYGHKGRFCYFLTVAFPERFVQPSSTLARRPASRLVIFRFAQTALPLLYPIPPLLQPPTISKSLQPLLVLPTIRLVPLARLLLTGLDPLPLPLLRRPWPHPLLCASPPP